MREFINIVTESNDPKALKARLRKIESDRRYLITAMCTNACGRAAAALAEGDTERHAKIMANVATYVEQAAALEKEATEVANQLNGV